MKMFIRSIGLTIARTIGSRIVDFRSGRQLGRALLLVWRGKIHVIGLKVPVHPAFLPQERLTYWRQELGFTVQPPPDFQTEMRNRPADGLVDGES